MRLLQVFLVFLLFVQLQFANAQERLAADYQGEKIYKVVEQMPRFPGCEHEYSMKSAIVKCAQDKMLDYIYSNLIYPKAAIENKTEGMAVVQFIVLSSGKIVDAKIEREIGDGCGQAAVDAVNSMPYWMPGKQNGQAVNVLYTLPIRFRLNEPHSSRSNTKTKTCEILIFNDTETIGAPFTVYIYNHHKKFEFKLPENEYFQFQCPADAEGLYAVSNKNSVTINTPKFQCLCSKDFHALEIEYKEENKEYLLKEVGRDRLKDLLEWYDLNKMAGRFK